MNNPAPEKTPKIDEVAQIVLNGPSIPTLVLRYRSGKKAEKVYKTLQDLWSDGATVVKVEGDMFSTTVNLSMLAHISLVVHKTRVKFTPFQ